MLRVDGRPEDDDPFHLLKVNVGGVFLEVPATPMQVAYVVAALRKELELHKQAILALHQEVERLQKAAQTKSIEE